MFGTKWPWSGFMGSVFPQILPAEDCEFDIGWNIGAENGAEEVPLLWMPHLGRGGSQTIFKLLGPLARDRVTGVEYGSVLHQSYDAANEQGGDRMDNIPVPRDDRELGLPLGQGLGGRDNDEFVHVEPGFIRVGEGLNATGNIGVPGLTKIRGYQLLTHSVKSGSNFDYSGVCLFLGWSQPFACI
jgi:hypothetical protein